jgi:hypothetical protein
VPTVPAPFAFGYRSPLFFGRSSSRLFIAALYRSALLQLFIAALYRSSLSQLFIAGNAAPG